MATPSASAAPVIVWFRRDLRVSDHPALTEAAAAGAPVVPVFLWEEDAPRPPGGASRWWLHHSLSRLDQRLREMGAPLLLLRGRAAEVLPWLAGRLGAGLVLWNRRCDPRDIARDEAVAEALAAEGRRGRACLGDDLFPDEALRSKAGGPFQVFTPFWRHCQTLPEPLRPLPALERLDGPWSGAEEISGERLEDWRLLPSAPDWSGGLAEAWTPGEAAGLARLKAFVEGHGDGALDGYGQSRDHPGQRGTSRLSPHLAFGEVSPRQIWHAARAAGAHPAESYLRELGWREFCRHALRHFPRLAEQPQRPEFAAFPWAAETPESAAGWRAFIGGRTGFPVVDAGMRELWATGWMHNRVRMIVGSFLVKDLLLPWQRGEAWFWDTLVDADPANNAGGWQWVAGCGLESAPYFRIFNPVLQGDKFDPRGRYVRRWVPELAGLPDLYLHRPWEAPAELLARAGIRLGQTYPHPILDHSLARRRALLAYEQMRGGRQK